MQFRVRPRLSVHCRTPRGTSNRERGSGKFSSTSCLAQGRIPRSAWQSWNRIRVPVRKCSYFPQVWSRCRRPRRPLPRKPFPWKSDRPWLAAPNLLARAKPCRTPSISWWFTPYNGRLAGLRKSPSIFHKTPNWIGGARRRLSRFRPSGRTRSGGTGRRRNFSCGLKISDIRENEYLVSRKSYHERHGK